MIVVLCIFRISSFNADFDGDEMNVHLPQDEVSRSEVVNIVNANRQYVVPASGKPVRGLIQVRMLIFLPLLIFDIKVR